jgi:hypothetical protein
VSLVHGAVTPHHSKRWSLLRRPLCSSSWPPPAAAITCSPISTFELALGVGAVVGQDWTIEGICVREMIGCAPCIGRYRTGDAQADHSNGCLHSY